MLPYSPMRQVLPKRMENSMLSAAAFTVVRSRVSSIATLGNPAFTRLSKKGRPVGSPPAAMNFLFTSSKYAWFWPAVPVRSIVAAALASGLGLGTAARVVGDAALVADVGADVPRPASAHGVPAAPTATP